MPSHLSKTGPDQVGVPDTSPPQAAVRIQLRELVHARGESVVTVTLARQGQRVVGIGRARAEAPASLEFLAADATVHALNRLSTPPNQLRLEHVQRTQLGELDLCLVQVTVFVDQEPQTAIGVGRIQHDIAEAAARAVLDATNRYFARLTPGLY
jgi:hypothetical protein